MKRMVARKTTSDDDFESERKQEIIMNDYKSQKTHNTEKSKHTLIDNTFIERNINSLSPSEGNDSSIDKSPIKSKVNKRKCDSKPKSVYSIVSNDEEINIREPIEFKQLKNQPNRKNKKIIKSSTKAKVLIDSPEIFEINKSKKQITNTKKTKVLSKQQNIKSLKKKNNNNLSLNEFKLETKVDDVSNELDPFKIIESINPKITVENTNYDIINKQFSQKNLQDMMNNLTKLTDKNSKKIVSDKSNKICRLNNKNIKTLLQKEYNEIYSTEFIKELNNKVFKINTLTNIGSLIQEHIVDICPGENESNLVMMIEFFQPKACFDYFQKMNALQLFEVAIFYKLGTKFVVGGSVLSYENLIENIKDHNMFEDLGIRLIKIEVYHDLCDIFADIHHYSKLEEKISLKYKLKRNFDIPNLIKQGYNKNCKRLKFKLFKQTKIKADITPEY